MLEGLPDLSKLSVRDQESLIACLPSLGFTAQPLGSRRIRPGCFATRRESESTAKAENRTLQLSWGTRRYSTGR